MNTTTTRSRRTRFALVAAAGVAVASTATVGATLLGGGSADARDPSVSSHPPLPCNLSVEAVANWGETSAHLPQACTYEE